MVADAGEAPGRMPLVQLVLTELWHRRTPSALTHDAYNSCGGVAGAFAIHAEEASSSPAPQAAHDRTTRSSSWRTKH
ncbi:hypothetical protein AB0O67_29305 [Streptomyces sp. NPDC086077]|uniref:nSTAND1 domain-containing NTPase n=1 Tax=Streptomyces sp. NPDC086077 TaxID=3154862 RepID=UPI003415EACA